MIKQFSLERFTERLGCEVYPITILKFLLNKRRIQSYFRKAADPEFELRIVYTLDNSGCEPCLQKESEGILCRQHTSIERVLNGNNVAFDVDTETYFYKNEIFKMIDNKLVIVYCPHSKLISGSITDSKVRKINPITVDDQNLELPNYENILEFTSNELLTQYARCWFNDEFTIVTVPNPEDINKISWCLIANR